jgi:WD40 repeat protein
LNFSVQYEPISFTHEQIKDELENPALIDMLQEAVPKIEAVLKSNLIIDSFKNNFLQLGEDDVGVDQGAQVTLLEYQSFTDLKHSKDKSISCIDWHPTQKGVVAMACTESCTLEEKIEEGFSARAKSSVLLLWNFSDPIHPQLLLEGPDEIQCFKFNPYNSSIIVAGCHNGQVRI